MSIDAKARQLLDRRCRQNLLAAHRLVTAGEYATDLMPGSQQGGQTFRGNIGGAHEQDAHKL